MSSQRGTSQSSIQVEVHTVVRQRTQHPQRKVVKAYPIVALCK